MVYPREMGPIADEPFIIGRSGGEEGLRYRFDVVRLRRLSPERVLATPDVGMRPLAALRGADEPMLRALAAHVARDSREQLRAWLGLTPVASEGA